MDSCLNQSVLGIERLNPQRPPEELVLLDELVQLVEQPPRSQDQEDAASAAKRKRLANEDCSHTLLDFIESQRNELSDRVDELALHTIVAIMKDGNAKRQCVAGMAQKVRHSVQQACHASMDVDDRGNLTENYQRINAVVMQVVARGRALPAEAQAQYQRVVYILCKPLFDRSRENPHCGALIWAAVPAMMSPQAAAINNDLETKYNAQVAAHPLVSRIPNRPRE